MADFTLVLSTPRSGTQWFASELARVYGDITGVLHEPIGYAYQPKRFQLEQLSAHRRSSTLQLTMHPLSTRLRPPTCRHRLLCAT